MDFKKVMLLVGALMVAAVTAVMAKNMFTGAGAQEAAAAAPAVQTGPKVLVARKDLPVGTIIDSTMLGYQAWPKDGIEGSYYTQGSADADPAQMLGTVVRYPVAAGQPVVRGALVGPKDRGFLAAALGPGMRAVTVPVSATSGVAGFIFPGDRVDIVLTQDVTGGGEGPALKVSETIVRNVRVLATDQRTDIKNEEGKTEVKTFSNVTMEATPRIAEKIAVAQSVGTLSLSLRSLADTTSELERAVASGEVKVPAGTSPSDERRLLSTFAARPMDTNTTYTTGGDVSRFQRRTVPTRAPSPADKTGDALTKFATALGGAASGATPGAAPAPTGPVVRVARGNNVTVVPVGAR